MVRQKLFPLRLSQRGNDFSIRWANAGMVSDYNKSTWNNKDWRTVSTPVRTWVSTELCQHGIYHVFCTSISSVLCKLPKRFRGISWNSWAHNWLYFAEFRDFSHHMLTVYCLWRVFAKLQLRFLCKTFWENASHSIMYQNCALPLLITCQIQKTSKYIIQTRSDFE